jgi:hypothetical protein
VTVIEHNQRGQGHGQPSRPEIKQDDRDEAEDAALEDWKRNAYPDGRPGNNRPQTFLSILMTSDGLAAEYLTWHPGREGDVGQAEDNGR